MDDLPRLTGAAAREIGEPFYRLAYLVRSGKVVPSARDSSGRYLWRDEDLARAREALQGKAAAH